MVVLWLVVISMGKWHGDNVSSVGVFCCTQGGPCHVYWQRLQAGYYVPDAEVVRENYKVQLPALHDLRRFGIYITYDCRFYDTYQLVRDDDYVRGLMFGSSFSLTQ